MNILEGTQQLYCSLPLKINSIIQIELAFDHSYVLLQRQEYTYFTYLYHVNPHGKIIYKYVREIKIEQFAMPTQDKVILSGDRFMIAINLRLQSEKVIEFEADIQ